MKTTIDYQRFNIKEGINLHLLQTSKFKSTLMKVYIEERLRQETAPMVALISYLLFRGTNTRKTTLEMMRYLEGLYGADFSTDVEKRGECQYLTLGLEVINRHYLPGGDDLLDEGLAFLMDVLTNPYTVNNQFNPAYFHQEKNILRDDIISLFNDKAKYAYERCKQLMCADEPYGIYKYGDIETLAEVTNDQLYGYYQRLLEENPIHIFMVGDLTAEDVLPKVKEAFADFAPRHLYFEPVVVQKQQVVTQRVIEEENLRQSKLSMGYRTPYTRRSDKYAALLVFNGIFGALPHSKLFNHVREKASLAYYIYSGLDSTKGIVHVDSGIEASALDRVLSIVDKQLEAIKDGQITPEEMEFTKKALSRFFRMTIDNNGDLVDSCMIEVSNKLEPVLGEFTEEIEKVTVEDIQEIARSLELDTVYFLKGEEDGDETDDLKGDA